MIPVEAELCQQFIDGLSPDWKLQISRMAAQQFQYLNATLKSPHLKIMVTP